MKIGTGLYGANGHQIGYMLVGHPGARLTAVCAPDPASLPGKTIKTPDIMYYSTLEEMLKDDKVELVSLCSPRRADQARDAVNCLKAGRHVYAEKPCAMTERELDEIIETSLKTGCKFHEMAGTAFEQPYFSMRKIIEAGAVGEVIQVFVQKSYPYHDRRPQDEKIDGGLIMQVGIHAVRHIEHVAGSRIKTVRAFETKQGNPCRQNGGDLHMAASFIMELENGGVASAIANYLNPAGFGKWGNEHLRIFGTKGFIESVDGGAGTRMVIGDTDMGPVKICEGAADYFNFFIEELLGKGNMPLSLEEELHPARIVIRAKNSASECFN